jgi:hypothetical protein
MRRSTITSRSLLLCVLSLAACESKPDQPAGDLAGAAPSSSVATPAGSAQPAGSSAAGSGTSSHLSVLSPPKSAYKDWQLEKDSFKFQNYGPGMADFGPDEMQRLCGERVCADAAGGACVLTPAVDQLKDELNKIIQNGHCDGMATLALLLQRGVIDATKFGAATAAELKLDGNKALQHEIAFWWATQIVSPVGEARAAERTKATPNEVIAALREGLEKDEPYTISFFMRNGTAGHATTPYAVEDKGDDIVWILHYDNNYPGEARHIEVNTEANSWKYTTSSDPNQETPDDYEGDAETHTLYLVPLKNRVGALACNGVLGEVGGTAGSSTALRTIFLEGEGHLLIHDDQGRKLGYDGDKLVSEIPGAYYDVLPTGGDTEEPVYYVPQGIGLQIAIDGSDLQKEETAAVALIGPGYMMAVDEITLGKDDRDVLTVSGDWSEVEYETETGETPILRLGVSTSGPDYEMNLKVAGEKAGQKVSLGIDLAKGTFAFLVDGGDGESAYGIELHRIDEEGEETFEHEGMAAGEDKPVTFDYGSWKGDKSPLKVTIGDESSDVEDSE